MQKCVSYACNIITHPFKTMLWTALLEMLMEREKEQRMLRGECTCKRCRDAPQHQQQQTPSVVKEVELVSLGVKKMSVVA